MESGAKVPTQCPLDFRPVTQLLPRLRSQSLRDLPAGLRARQIHFQTSLGLRVSRYGAVIPRSFSGFRGPERAQETDERPVGNQMSAQKSTKKPRDGP